MSESLSSAASLNIGLLKRLRDAWGEYVSIDELARGPGEASTPGDRRNLHADLDALATFGFAIVRHPERGAAYLGPADRLCPDQIEHELGTERVGRRIAVWHRASSTNDLAAMACGSPSNDGLVVLADEQTAGRGRLGRSWIAPPRSAVLMSVVLHPPRDLDPVDPEVGAGGAWLTAMAAVAVAEVVSDRIGRAAAIKWPNDVRVDGRKIAGILVERPAVVGPAREGDPARPVEFPGRPAVIGIGLNVNLEREAFPEDLRPRATSIRIERDGRPADRSEVARDLIRRLDHWYRTVRSEGRAAIEGPWRDRSEHLGRIGRVVTPSGPRSGRIVGLDLRNGATLHRIGREGAGPALRIPLADILAIETDPRADHGGPWTSTPRGS